MKKIIFLLLLISTTFSYGQTTLANKLKITGNVEDITATKVAVQTNEGLINWRDVLDIRGNGTILSTGLIKNGLISANGDPTKFNVTTGIGVVSNFDTPENPISRLVTFPAFTGITPTYLLTGTITYVAIEEIGTSGVGQLFMQATPFTPEQRRSLIVLGAVVHSNLTTINVINNISAPTNSSTNQLHDFIEAVGALNLTGNKYTANGANLQLNKSAGLIFKLGSNFANDWKNPHELAQTAGTSLTFRYRTQNGTEGSDRINLDPALYDLNNVLTSVPNNKFTIQTVTMFQSGVTRIQYGQNVYDDLATAKNAVFTRNFVLEPNSKENGIIRAYIIMKNTTTSLQNVADADILETQKFGGVASGGVALTLANIVTALGFAPENVANKATDFNTVNNTLYPTVEAVDNELYAKQSYGFTVYDKSYWANLSDFSVTGFSPSIVNQGSVNLTGGSTDMSQYMTIPNYANSDENLDIEVTFLVNNISGRSPSIGKKSINASGDLSGDLTMSYDFSTNFIRCDQTAGNAYASGFVVAVGDLCSMKVSQRGEDVTVTFTNINQDKIATNSFKFYTTNVSDLAIYNGFSSVDIKKIKVTSASNRNPDVLYIGDSKTQLPLGVNKGNRFSNYTSQFGVIDVFAGHGDKTAETLAGLPYIINHIKPKYVVLNQLRNDLDNGVSSVTYQANYNSIVSQLNGIGATVVHLLPIPETVLDQSAITTFISTNFTNLINPSAFDPFTQTSDGFHPNDSGSRFLSNLIVNSGYIPTSNRYENKNLLNIFTDFAKINKSNYFPLIQDFSTIKLPGTTAQYVRGDGTLATLPTYTIPVGGNPTATVGVTAVNGSASTFMRSDASPALNVAVDRTWSGIHTFTNAGAPNNSTANAALQLTGGIGVAKQSYFGNGIYLAGGHNLNSSIYSFGIFGSTTNPSTATTQEISTISLGVNTFAGTYTTAFVNLLNLSNGITKGAGHTITYAAGLKLSNLTQGTNNVNIGVNANSLAGNWSIYNNSAHLNYLGTGNTLINSATDNGSGAKLQITGGITATSYTGGATLTGNPTAPTPTLGDDDTSVATTAFVTSAVNTSNNWTKSVNDIQNNNSGFVKIGTTPPNVYSAKLLVDGGVESNNRMYATGFQTGNGSGTFNGSFNGDLNFRSNVAGNSSANHFTFKTLNSNLSTSGTESLISTPTNFAPTSGTSVYNIFSINPTINQTGGANGITRSLYINPTLTSAFDYRAIEVTAGKTVLQETEVTTLKTTVYTVATLPTPTGIAYATVSDALAPSYMATVVGGGSIVTPVFYNGTNWVAH